MPQASQWSRTCGIFIGDRKERERDDWWMGNIGECSVSFVSNLRYIYDISSLLLLNWEGMQMKTHTAGATRSDMEVLFISLYKFLKHFLPLPAVVVVWPIGQWNSHKMYKQILASDLIGIRMVTKGGCVNIDTWGNKKIQKKTKYSLNGQNIIDSIVTWIYVFLHYYQRPQMTPHQEWSQCHGLLIHDCTFDTRADHHVGRS